MCTVEAGLMSSILVNPSPTPPSHMVKYIMFSGDQHHSAAKAQEFGEQIGAKKYLPHDGILNIQNSKWVNEMSL